MDTIQQTKLANGVRILTEHLPYVGSASIGVWCTTGSTHETEHEAGITHFIEHMLFKGTPKRTSHQIAEAIEGRGGMLNAFTDKERTCYYCRVLAEDSGVGFDVLSDMVANALLDADELEKEKGVVLEEIKRSEDEPGDHVHELHIEGLWPSSKFGLPIIGTKESVSGYSREDLVNYMNRRYNADTIVVTAAGNVNHQDFVNWAQVNLGHLKPGETSSHLDRPSPIPGDNYVGKEVEQVHFCIGTTGVNYYDTDFYTLVVLDGVLGGGMSSRLFQEVREKRGLVYSIGSYMLSYTAGGAFTIYGGTGAQTWKEVQTVVRAELDKMMNDGPTEAEVAKVKKQIAGNLVLGMESTSARMQRMAKNEIVHGRQIPMEETVTNINNISRENIQELATRMFQPEQMRITVIGPQK
ncbi:MAG: M16 family metallopeptidase [Fimbriimonadaceae bacterium]